MTIKKETNLPGGEIKRQPKKERKNDVILTFDMMKQFEGKIPGQKAFEWDRLKEYKMYKNQIENDNSYNHEEINDSLITQHEISDQSNKAYSLQDFKDSKIIGKMNKFNSKQDLEIKEFKPLKILPETKSEKEDREMLDDLNNLNFVSNKKKNFSKKKTPTQIEL